MVERRALAAVVRQKLVQNGLLSEMQEFDLRPYHAIAVDGMRYTHFIIACSKSEKNFFLKVMKPNDGAPHCNAYLQKIHDEDGRCPYPVILVPAFYFHGIHYYITDFVDGQTLDELPETLPNAFWDGIADKLYLRYSELGAINATHYSEHGKFVSDDCSSIFLKKLAEKLPSSNIPLSGEKRRRAFAWCRRVMETCDFSVPTLLHMDIKPANIVYDPGRDSVSLIDFEFARFGDTDYGWTQLLLSGINRFNSVYINQIVPRVTGDRLTLKDAVNIPKYQCYLFYQLICNFNYYNGQGMSVPEAMESLFEQLTNLF